MAEAFFGDAEKAVLWLSKTKDRFSGKSPLSMLTTTVGTRKIEEMLCQLA
ncbi:MbcA/ParS/Xre antitoxin family protein [Pseudomonas sp. Z13]|nr:MbcA/ParS/Xre antitoxin family protein [Pseudomonas sp. Z13]